MSAVKIMLNPFTGQFDLVSVAAAEPVVDSIETETEQHLTTEAGDYLVPEA